MNESGFTTKGEMSTTVESFLKGDIDFGDDKCVKLKLEDDVSVSFTPENRALELPPMISIRCIVDKNDVRTWNSTSITINGKSVNHTSLGELTSPRVYVGRTHEFGLSPYGLTRHNSVRRFQTSAESSYLCDKRGPIDTSSYDAVVEAVQMKVSEGR